MRRKDKEITDINLIEHILKNGKLCHLAMSGHDEPYMVTVNYGYRDHCIYFHSAPQGRKMDMLKSNPVVCFMVITDEQLVSGENPCRDWTMKYQSVIGYGKAMILENQEEKAAGLKILMEQYSDQGGWEFSQKNLDETAVVKIVINVMTGKTSGY